MTLEQMLAAASAAGWEVWNISRAMTDGQWSVRMVNAAAHRYQVGKTGPTIHDNPDVSVMLMGDTLHEAVSNVLDELAIAVPREKTSPGAALALDLAAMLR